MARRDELSDPAGQMKARLRADLQSALKGKRRDEARVLRALLGAIDNSEAPPLETAPPETSEIERLQLSALAVREIIAAEIRERERAAEQLDQVRRPDHAETVRAEARVARRYLDAPD